jgi:hypothetical protein
MVMNEAAFSFGYYLVLSTRPNSSAQSPEKLFREHALMGLIAVFFGLFILTTWVDIPMLSVLSGQRYISIR